MNNPALPLRRGEQARESKKGGKNEQPRTTAHRGGRARDSNKGRKNEQPRTTEVGWGGRARESKKGGKNEQPRITMTLQHFLAGCKVCFNVRNMTS